MYADSHDNSGMGAEHVALCACSHGACLFWHVRVCQVSSNLSTHNFVGTWYACELEVWVLVMSMPAMYDPAAMVRMAGVMQRSTAVMKEVNMAIRAPELQRTMMEMSKEMMKVRYENA